MPLTIEKFLSYASRELNAVSSSARLDGEVLLMHVCAQPRSGLVTHSHTELSAEQQRRLEQLLARRKQGEPIAYLTGTREFWSMEFYVTPATLIPRPETELLVEKALAHIPQNASWTIADVGAGCGAIALALAKERPSCRILALDISPQALAIVKLNANKFGLANVELRESNWFSSLSDEKMEMIVSNPPYVRGNDPHLKQGDVRFEPTAALVGGPDGLDAIRTIAQQARACLVPGGYLLLEHGHDQAQAVADILRAAAYGDIDCHFDLAGRPRVTECRRTSAAIGHQSLR